MSTSPASETLAAEQFVVRVGELLHAYGTPAPRVERRLGMLAERIGLRAHVFSTPTAVHVGFDTDAGQRVYLRRVHPGEINLGKLVEFDEVLERVGRDGLPLAVARRRIEELAAAPPRFGAAAVITAWAGASATAAVLFGGGYGEMIASAIIGLVLGVLARLWPTHSETTGLLELIAAFVCSVLSIVLAAIGGPIADRVVVLASLIVLFPGLSLTVAMVELATRHLASGTARLGGALTTLLLLAFGVALGRILGHALVPAQPPIEPQPVPFVLQLGTIFVSPVALAVLFQARRREFGWILLAGLVGAVAGRAGPPAFGVELGSLIGALSVGLVSNAFARMRDRPASVLLMPGLLVLVPGSLGYRALDLFMAREAIAGLSTGFETTVVGIALVGGLLIANVVLPPRRAL